MERLSNKQLAVITAAFALMLGAWEASGLDLSMARWFGGPGGFALHENWFLTHVLHDGAKRVAWVLILLLCLWVWWPLPRLLRRLTFHRRMQLAGTALLAVLVVSLIKSASTVSCPWSLSDFGGVAHYVPHWLHLFEADGGSGRCFPAGHASSGFAFLGGYFVFRRTDPTAARAWLVASLLAGLTLGLAQQMRGAHFTSHTLWTGWICWCVAWTVDVLCTRMELSRPGQDMGDTA